MDAISNPTSAYAAPPTGNLPARCPACNCVLDHFLCANPQPVEPALVGVPEQIAAGKQQPERAANMRLPTEQQRSETVTAPAPAIPPTLRMTVCVLLYGEYTALHRRCLISILSAVPRDSLDLRIACNQLVPESLDFARSLPATKLYIDNGDRRKYPAMREMFYDPVCPITSDWICWFDDDSYVRSPQWYQALVAATAARAKDLSIAMFGQRMFHPLRARPGHDPRTWFRDATWFKQRQFRNKHGQATPNGDCIHFITGGFWCLSTAAMRAADIPDRRLNHNGGDICIGEQLWQNGYTTRQFNDNKLLVHTSNHARRGYNEKFPWL